MPQRATSRSDSRQILDSNDAASFFAIAFIVSFGFAPRVWRLGSSKGVVAASRRLSAAEPSATSPVEKFRADESRSFKCFRAFTAAYQMFLLTPLSPSLSPCSQCTNTYADQNAVFHPHVSTGLSIYPIKAIGDFPIKYFERVFSSSQ